MRTKKTLNYIVLIGFYFLLLSSFFSFTLVADNSTGSKITIDWEEFRSLLKLDADEIRLSWKEFSKLMEQTGAAYKSEYRIESGEVILSREEFKKLLEQMKPPLDVDLKAPRDYIITKAEYSGLMRDASTTFTVVLSLQIFDRDKESYLKIPLFSEVLAISEVQLDGRPASLITEGGWHYLSTSVTGWHSVSVKFSVNSSPDKGSPGLSFNIPETPVTYLTLDIPRTGLEVSIQNAQEVKKTEAKGHTLTRGYLSPASYMNISWRKEDKRIDRGPARIYSEVFNLLSIEADAISVTTRVELNVMQNKINIINLIVPENYQVVDVDGEGVADWSVREEKARQLLDISFEYPFEGTKVLTLKSERLLPEETIAADFEGFEVLESLRESGYVAGVVKSDAEAEVQEFSNLERIDFQKTPSQLSNLSAMPILFAFKYLRHPFNMVVRITKYEKEEALTSFIDLAKGITLFMEDGKMVHQVTFTMQNLWDQFLRVNLAENVSIWSVYVNGKREKASKGDNGRVLIPLARSERSFDGSLIPFDIELVYTEEVEGFNFLGKKKNYFPATDILINKAEWTLYLPVNYDYMNFGGNLRHKVAGPILVEDISGVLEDGESIAVEPSVDEAGITLSEEKAKSMPEVPKEAVVSQVDKVSDRFATGKAGLLSVKVNVPISGVQYTFEKKLVEREEALFLDFNYANELITKSIIILLIVILLFIIYRKRKMFIPLFKVLVKGVSKILSPFKLVLRPGVFLIIVVVILFLSIFAGIYWYYPLFFFVILLFFGASIVRFVQSRRENSH
jgi:hypothetical protein